VPEGAGAPYVAVVGPGDAEQWALQAARELGDALARGRAIVVCGGLGGVMEAACRGAAEAGGTTLGLLPGADRSAANPWVSVAVPTGLGELRNGLVVRCADVVVAVGGGFGTLSEIALALKLGRPVIGIRTWDIAAPVERIDDVSAAARRALEVVTSA
jgi:uncharacterized protein (TIGR00725 family)